MESLVVRIKGKMVRFEWKICQSCNMYNKYFNIFLILKL